VEITDFPGSVQGLTVVDDDGFATIYLNAKMCCEMRETIIEHELRHVRRDDVHNGVRILRAEA